jgi:hypothetical protein
VQPSPSHSAVPSWLRGKGRGRLAWSPATGSFPEPAACPSVPERSDIRPAIARGSRRIADPEQVALGKLLIAGQLRRFARELDRWVPA